MADSEISQSLCNNCDTVIDEPTDTPQDDRQPCPQCGSTARKFRVTLRSTIEATSRVTATLTTNEAGQTDAAVTLKSIRVSATIPPLDITTDDDLPTEVITEALGVGIIILPPIDGRWPIEVTGYGVIGYVGVGDLSDGLLNAMAWIEQLALRWEQRLNEDDT